MALSRPLLNEEHLLLVAHDRAGGSPQHVNYIIERPAEGGLPELIRIVDDDDNALPIYISSDEEEEGEFEGIPPVSEDDEDEEDQDTDSNEDEDEEDNDMEDDWTSEDSGYDTMTEDEEDVDDSDDGDNLRPRSPLIQQLPPENFWQGWRRLDPPVPAAGPRHLIFSRPQVQPQIPEQQLEQPDEGLPLTFSLAGHCSSWASAFQQSEDSAPSTSGHTSAIKRSREESPTEEVSGKRQRQHFEESLEESAPSTSGVGCLANRSRQESYWESMPSTSGLGSFTNRRHWLDHFACSRRTDDSDSD